MEKTTLTEKLYNRVEVLLLNLVPTGSVWPLFKWLFKLPILQYRLGIGWMIGGYIAAEHDRPQEREDTEDAT